MERTTLPPFLVIFGVGIVLVASLGFVLSSLARGAHGSEPETAVILATRMPVATSATIQSPMPAPVTEPPSPLPTLASTNAPDFTLERSDGSVFTLSEQWAQGSVVLVFFQRCSS
jgi:cytochrome oxidase Cu insertion factor (SCO1/SenC/PrrC family)